MSKRKRDPTFTASEKMAPVDLLEPLITCVEEEIRPNDSQLSHHTPLRTHTGISGASRSRRRLNLWHEKETINLPKERVNILLEANKRATEVHDLQMRILKIKEEKEEEILKQEKLKVLQEEIKLKILELELKKLTN